MSENPKQNEDAIDAKIREVFCDVPVPAGLESRILAALADAPGSDEIASSDKPMPADDQPKSGRLNQHWYLAASAVFVAASLLLAVLLQWNSTPPISESTVVQMAMAQFDFLEPGRPLTNNHQDEIKIFRSCQELDLSGCKEICWQPVDKVLGKKGVLYTFLTPNNAQAQLYVLESPKKINSLPNIPPPRTPHGDTGGLLAATWQANGRLYILVLRGNKHSYRDLLAPAGPLT
jgi:hypothetical protein